MARLFWFKNSSSLHTARADGVTYEIERWSADSPFWQLRERTTFGVGRNLLDVGKSVPDLKETAERYAQISVEMGV